MEIKTTGREACRTRELASLDPKGQSIAMSALSPDDNREKTLLRSRPSGRGT
jgi:hypothetical protein